MTEKTFKEVPAADMMGNDLGASHRVPLEDVSGILVNAKNYATVVTPDQHYTSSLAANELAKLLGLP